MQHIPDLLVMTDEELRLLCKAAFEEQKRRSLIVCPWCHRTGLGHHAPDCAVSP